MRRKYTLISSSAIISTHWMSIGDVLSKVPGTINGVNRPMNGPVPRPYHKPGAGDGQKTRRPTTPEANHAPESKADSQCTETDGNGCIAIGELIYL